MFRKIKDFWNQIPPQDRRLIRWTALVCYGLVVLTLVILFFYASSVTSPAASPTPDSTFTQESDSLPAPPLPAHEAILASLDSFDQRAHRELARIYLEKKQYDQSLIHAERVAPWLEEDLEFQGQIGVAYLNAGKPSAAIPHLEKALRLNPDDPLLFADLALARFRAVHPDSGIKTIEAALQKFPDHPHLMTHRAAMCGEIKEYQARAEDLFHKLIRRHPAYPEARYQFGRFLMNQGNYASAHRELLQARKLDPFNPRVHARLGMAEFYLSRDNAAEIAYKTALAMNPQDYNTWYNLGELYLSQANESDQQTVFIRKSRMALEAYLTALANEPHHAQAHYRVGTLLNLNRQHREAIQHLQQALAQDPQSVPILLQLSAAWEALGNSTQAWEYMRQAYELDPFNQLLTAQMRRLKNEKHPGT